MLPKPAQEIMEKITEKNESASLEQTKEVLLQQRDHINRQLARIESHEIALEVNTLATRLADTANALSVMQSELNRGWLRLQQMHEDILRIKQKLDKS